MSYVVNKDLKSKNKKEEIDLELEGFSLPSKKGKFKIDDMTINNITLINTNIINAFITGIVLKRYNKLIKKITEELLDDEGEGSDPRLIIDDIEKFRIEVKTKYRKYLDKKTLEKMSKKLKFFISEINEEVKEKESTKETSKGRSR